MSSETIILITVISSALLSPFLNYLYNSRCHRIKCLCLECDRTINEDPKDLQTQSTELESNQK